MNKTFNNGCCPNPFKKDWEQGHDPLKPHIETENDKGEKINIKPCSKLYDLVEMKDDEIGDFLNEEEKKYIKILRKQRKEIGNRDLCKEKQEEKDREVMKIKELMTQKDEIIDQQNKKINELQNVLVQHNTLLSQIVAKLNN